MKKLSLALLSAVSLVALTTGCSSSEVIEEGPALQTGAITFGATNVAKASRTNGVLSNGNFETFHVYGYYTTDDNKFENVNIFSGEPVKKAGDKWTYEVNRYWLPNATYNFYAYSCGNAADNLPDVSTNGEALATPDLFTGEDGKTYFAITDFRRHGEHDLIFAKAEDKKGSEGQTVEFRFYHILTRLKFSFKGEVPDGHYRIKVDDLKLNGLLDEASYNVGDRGMWNEYSSKTSEENFHFGETATSGIVPNNKIKDEVKDANSTLETAPIFVIPNQEYIQNYKDADDYDNTVVLSFKMIIEMTKDAEVTATSAYEQITTRNVRATLHPSWVKGNSYNYQLNLSFKDAAGLKPIEFKGSIVANGTDSGDTWVVDTNGFETGTGTITFETYN